MDSPSGGAPMTAPRCDLVDTESYSGGIRVLAPYLVVWGYVGIYRRKEYVGGATGGPQGWRARLGGEARPLPHGHLVASLTSTPSLLDCVSSKKYPREGFIPFGFRLIFLLCKTLKLAKKNSNLHWAFG